MRQLLGFLAPSTLEAAYRSGDERRLIEELRKVKSHRSRRAPRVSKVIRILKETKSPRVRNAAALALADMHAESAKSALIEMLTNPHTKGARGTLVYALRELGARVPAELLFELITNDTFETSAEAVNLLADQREDWSDNQVAYLKSKLRAVLETSGGKRNSAASTALEYLSEDSRPR